MTPRATWWWPGGGATRDGENLDLWAYDADGDTWLLDVDTGTWEEVIAEPSPTTRQDYALALDPATGLIMLVGGVGSDVAQEAENTDRVWAFDANART